MKKINIFYLRSRNYFNWGKWFNLTDQNCIHLLSENNTELRLLTLILDGNREKIKYYE